uniref:Uncharacterized protein n=1 Tax=Picea glauca TaxID=3330 RepID=A0A101M522_PICGL|nr:hypothetical protein ABT39_MTgene816 [Picea glauca]
MGVLKQIDSKTQELGFTLNVPRANFPFTLGVSCFPFPWANVSFPWACLTFPLPWAFVVFPWAQECLQRMFTKRVEGKKYRSCRSPLGFFLSNLH